jgi:hypothetical protein
MRSSLTAAALIALLWPAPSFGQQADALNGFRNLSGVFIVVDALDPITGLTQDGLRKDAELWLQKAGIKVLTRDQFLAAAGRPALYVTIDAVQSNAPELKDIVLFHVQAALYQNASLQRLPTTSVSASTWSIDRLGFSAKTLAPNFIRTGLQDLIEKFVAAYQEANQKGGAPTAAAGAPRAPAAAAAQGAKPAQPESKRFIEQAHSIAIRQSAGDRDLSSGVEKALGEWGRFSIVQDSAQADVLLDISISEAKAFAVLTSRQGQHLWDDVRGVDTKDDGVRESDAGAATPTATTPDIQALGEGLIVDLQSFVGQ